MVIRWKVTIFNKLRTEIKTFDGEADAFDFFYKYVENLGMIDYKSHLIEVNGKSYRTMRYTCHRGIFKEIVSIRPIFE